MSLFAGRLDNEVVFQTLNTSRGTTGQEKEGTVASSITDFAMVEQLAGNEKYESMQLTEKADIKITIRYRTDINAAMRVMWEGKWYNIYTITEITRHVGLRILAKEIVQT